MGRVSGETLDEKEYDQNIFEFKIVLNNEK